MPEKLVTMVAPPGYAPDGVSGTNIDKAPDDADVSKLVREVECSVAAHAQDQARVAEIEAFTAVRAPIGVAEYRTGVLSADLARHLLSLRQNIRIRTAEVQAELALSDLDAVIVELRAAREKLLGVLGRGEDKPQQERS